MGGRIGHQRPRLLALPAAPAVDSFGPQFVELGEQHGLFLDDWQQFILNEGLAVKAGGKFRSIEAAEEVPRQNGKTAPKGLLAVGAPTILGARLVIYTAHEFKTALETYEFCLDLIGSGPLSGELVKTRRSGTETGIEFRDGSRIRFLARSRGSGRGFSSDVLILDEAYALQPHQVGAVLPTLSARPNPIIWYGSSAPMHDSLQLHAVRQRAVAGQHEGTRSLAYFGWGVDPDNPPAPTDLDGWYEANPALGIRITEEFIQTEQEAMPSEEFARERLGIPDLPDGSPDLNLGGWSGLADRESRVVRPLGFGLDVTMERDYAAFGVAGMRRDGLAHVEVVDHLRGTDWVVDRAVKLWNQWKAPIWVQAGSPGAAYVEVLEAKAVEVRTHPEGGGAAALLVDAIQSGRLRHIGQHSLAAALADARRRHIGDRWTWARPATGDVTPLTAVSLAHYGAMVEPAPPPVRKAQVL